MDFSGESMGLTYSFLHNKLIVASVLISPDFKDNGLFPAMSENMQHQTTWQSQLL
jgi:hypothetical protein